MAAIADELCDCPLGAWVDVDDFSRFIVASDRAFEVTHDAWKLYIAVPQYGSLGYDGFGTWNTLQLLYLAAAIATHKEAARLRLCAGERRLVVRLEHEEKFRALARILGFGVAS